MRKLRLWRVESTHINGYTAPSQTVETEGGRLWEAEKEALDIAKANNRLADFPQKWTITVHQMDRVNLNGKWYEPHIFSLKTGLVRDNDGRWVKPKA